ncbi:protein spinster-like [Penaeus japonicus]|uniref:protein spinster-like n=1 Tax=Penaeus japonicus TaxID=27405 RepID=UPI001C713F95|nr:protein spinster-like [Penaeus japonicus]
MPPYNIQKRDSLKLQNIADMEGDLRNNLSRQELIRHPDDTSDPNVVVVPRREDAGEDGSPQESPRLTRKQKTTVAILCFVNLINYMDRFTVAGILGNIKDTFNMTESQSGLLQTAFVLVYMIMAPVFGYLGDRFSRKYLMAVGIFFWCLATLVGSFMPNYLLFLLFRCFVGVGEASYSTIAPTIISDLFVKDLRSKMLAVFYFAIPVGSGLGYIIGAEVTNLMEGTHGSEAWRWGLRVTPVMGFLALFLILFCLQEPPRGESEGGQHLQSTSFLEDLGYLFTNKSFILSTLAFTCVTFVAGALAWWGPYFTQLGVSIQHHPNAKEDDVAFVFGAIAMTAGLIGVPLGSFAGQKLRIRFPFADPLVCGVGLLISVPLIIAAMVMAEFNTIVSYVVVFFGQVFLNLNWAVVSDIVLYIVIPTRRSSAEAFQILFSHALGDAGSPYLIGVVAEALQPYVTPRNTTENTTMEPLSTTTLEYFNTTEPTITTTVDPLADDYVKFKALQYSMFLCAIVNILGAIFFFLNSCFIRKDKEKCDQIIAENTDPSDLKTESNGHAAVQSTTVVEDSQKF